MTDPRERPDTPRDRRIPYYFAIVFVFFVSLDIFMAYLAIKTNPGVLTEHAYEVGLKYNDVLAQARTQDEKGLVGDIILTKAASGDQVHLIFTLHAKGQVPVNDLKGTVRLIRAVQAGFDQSAALTFEKQGRYGAVLPLPLKGSWTVEIKGTSAKLGDYILSKPVEIP